MPSYVTPKKNVQFIFSIGLFDYSDSLKLKSNPTLTAGDFRISKDNGAFDNLASLPTVTPAADVQVKVIVSADEMNADNVFIVWSDSDDEWCDGYATIQTTAQQIDDLSDFDETADEVDVGAVKGVAVTGVADFKATGFATATVCTEARLAELGATNIPADVDTLKSRLSAARAGYLDVLAGWTGTLLSAIRALARKDVSANADIGGTHLPSTDSEEGLRAKLDALGTTVTVQLSSVVEDEEWEWYTHDTITQPVTDLGDITGYKRVIVTLKKKATDPDSKAVLLFSDDVGLEVLNKSDDVTAGDASVTVDDASAGDITMKLEIGVTTKVAPDDELIWGVKWIDADDDPHTLVDGTSEVKAGPVKATS
jgi:hypothetical protein